MSSYAISAENVTRRFGDRVAVDAVDLRVEPGRIFGLVGVNGAGKSTMINMLCGLLAPSSGRIEIAGADLAGRPLEAKRLLGVVPDNLYLFERLSGEEQIRFSGQIYGLAAPEAAKRTRELLDVLGLASDAGRLITHYSHGMKKKVALACALIHAPPVLLLDEPFEGVDALLAGSIRDLLKRVADAGTSILLTSHVLPLIVELSDEIGVLHQGRLVVRGAPAEICQAGPRSLEELLRSIAGAGQKTNELAWFNRS